MKFFLSAVMCLLTLSGCGEGNPTDSGNPDLGMDTGSDQSEPDMPLDSPPDLVAPYEYDSYRVEGIEYEDILGNLRTVPVLARVPIGLRGPLPLVLLSHGGAGGKENPQNSLSSWGEYLATQGYLTVAVAHSGRTPASYQELCDAIGVPAVDTVQCGVKIHWDRPHDVKAVLDYLNEPSSGLEWIEHADLSRVAHVGHSAGGGATLMLAGAKRNFKCAQPLGQAQGSRIPCSEQDLVDMRDPRISVAVALSPQGINDEGFMRESFLTVDVPMMFLTGAADGDPGVPDVRMTSFDYVAEGEHRAVFLDDVGAVHGLFEGDLDRCSNARSAAQCETMRSWLFQAVDGFLARHLLGDSSRELTHETLQENSEGIASMMAREDAPRPIDFEFKQTCPVDPTSLRQGAPAGDALKRLTLRDTRASCNDGSQAIAYVRRAADLANAGRWVIYLQGGGSCDGDESCQDRWCAEQGIYDAGKMSSRWARPSIDGRGVFNRAPQNPLGGANQVYVHYCSSDRWLGQRSRVRLEDGDYILNARGHDIVNVLLEELSAGAGSDDGTESLPRLTQAELVVWTGSSAGSVGATSHLDFVAERLAGVRVVGAFDAGFGPRLEALNSDVAEAAIAHLESSHARFDAVIDAFYDTSCVAAEGDVFRCGDANRLKEGGHLTTPFFQRLDLRDSVATQGLGSLGVTPQEWSTQARVSMVNLGQSGAGVFAPSCRQHVALTNDYWFGQAEVGAQGDRESFASALAKWLANEEVRIVDSIDGQNSTCGMVTDDRE